MAALGEPVRLERGEGGCCRGMGAPSQLSAAGELRRWSCCLSRALGCVAGGLARALGAAFPVPPHLSRPEASGSGPPPCRGGR